MSLPRVIFYGYAGFEAEIVEAGLSNLGFTVASVSDAEELIVALDLDPDAIVLIDSAGRRQELDELLPLIEERGQNHPVPIWIMDSQDHFRSELPGVRVVPAPHRLKGAVFGIADYVGLSERLHVVGSAPESE